MSAVASAGGLRASAYISPEGDRVTVLLLNTDAQAHTVALATDGFIASGSSALRTAGDLERTSALDALAMQNAVTLPSRSVATVVFDGAVGD